MPRKTATEFLKVETTEDKRIQIPYDFHPRPYQIPVMTYMDQAEPKVKRAIMVWHRRAGKDLVCVNQTIKMALRAPVCGTYLFIYPKLTQGRRDLWDAKTSGGRPFRSYIPPELVLESSETEMQIILRPMPYQATQVISAGKGRVKEVGSVLQVMGTDKDSIDGIRGINTAGVVFSEFADQNPDAWEKIIAPVLLENGGWAMFDFTPKGKNHAHKLYEAAKLRDNWFTQILTVEDTTREDGMPVVTQAQIQEERELGTAEEIIQQEYYCSFEGFLHGTIFGDLLRVAQGQHRIGRIPHVTNLPVGTMWDIGRSDGTAIWFYQCVGSEIRFIDYYANVKQGADHYVKVLRDKPYLYGKLILPHDAEVKGYTATESTREFLEKTLCRAYTIAPKLSVQQGIDITRRLFSRMYFDEVNCGQRPHPDVASGLEALQGYRRAWDGERGDYAGEPIHDKHSHGADALRTGAVGWEEGMDFLGEMANKEPFTVDSDFDPREIALGPLRRYW